MTNFIGFISSSVYYNFIFPISQASAVWHVYEQNVYIGRHFNNLHGNAFPPYPKKKRNKLIEILKFPTKFFTIRKAANFSAWISLCKCRRVRKLLYGSFCRCFVYVDNRMKERRDVFKLFSLQESHKIADGFDCIESSCIYAIALVNCTPFCLNSFHLRVCDGWNDGCT